ARFHGRAGRLSRAGSPGGRGGGPRRTARRTAYRTRMKPAAVRAFFETLRAQNPAPRSELEYRNPFELLVAVILSAQATDASVNKATPGLFAEADSPERMAALGLAGIKRHIKSIGLFNTKARNIL